MVSTVRKGSPSDRRDIEELDVMEFLAVKKSGKKASVAVSARLSILYSNEVAK